MEGHKLILPFKTPDLYELKDYYRIQDNSVAYCPSEVCTSLRLSRIIVNYKEKQNGLNSQ